MTTILKALQELERQRERERCDESSPRPVAAWVDPERGGRWRWIAGALLALAGVGLGIVLRDAGSSTASRAPAAVAEPRLARREVATASMPPLSPAHDEAPAAEEAPGRNEAPAWDGRTAAEEAPWGRVEKSVPAAAAAPASAAPPAARRPGAPVRRTAAVAPQAAVEPVAPGSDERPVEEFADEPAREDAEPPARASTTGEPRVQVSAIAYSTDTLERTVTLRFRGGRAVTLREGESAGGLEVQLILPRMVYLRHGGSIFAVNAGR